MTETLSLNSYRLLGRSGLRVSPLSLGTMTFGTEWGWGTDTDEARRIFETYVDRGGNFIDTANSYTEGTSEQLVGTFASGRRDRLVISTKYTLPTYQGDPNSCGNHRKSMVRSVECSLQRLRTDYLDLLYLHIWDSTTPVEEILRAMDDLVRCGKVLYLGISDTPAWQVARMQAIADLRGWSPLIALQIEYNLLERTVERDLIPMAREMGLGVIPWSPLKSGILTGKYTRADLDSVGNSAVPDGTRKNVLKPGVSLEKCIEITNVVKAIATETNFSPSQISLAWTLLNPSVIAPTVGVRTVDQLQENLCALEVTLTKAQLDRLEKVSAVDLGFPYTLFLRTDVRKAMFNDMKIVRRDGSR